MPTKRGELNGSRVEADDLSSMVAEDLAGLTAAVVSAYVEHNPLSSSDLPALIRDVHTALRTLGTAPTIEEKLEPAVPIRKSITPDYIVCLDDGKQFRSMKRHLRNLGMTPDEYRKKWDLPFDYPMVAPSYSAVRSQLAKDNGLGSKGKAAKTPKPRSNVAR